MDWIKKNLQGSNQMVTIVIALLAVLVGVMMPYYVGAMDGQLGKLAAFPAFVGLAILLLYDRKIMLLLIFVLRSTGDVLLESTRFSLGGYQLGVGGVINAFVILIALILFLEKPKALPKSVLVFWAPILCIAIFGVIVSPFKSEAIRSWLSLISYFAIFTSAFHFVKTPADFRYCVKIMLWSTVLPALYALGDMALHGMVSSGAEGFRLRSTFSHPNVFAFYLSLMISLSFYLLKSPGASMSKPTRIGLSLYMGLLIVLLLLTKTRSAWIGCYVGFLLYAVFFERRFIIYLLMAPVLAMLIPGISDRVLDLTKGNQIVNYSSLNSFAWRKLLWTSAISWTQPKDYFLGHGLQTFQPYSVFFFPLAGKTGFGAHSVFVQYFFEMGILGVAAYLWTYYQSGKKLLKMLGVDRLGAFMLIVAILNYLIVAFSDNMADYLVFNWYFWFIVAAGCAVSNVAKTYPDQKQQFDGKQ